MLLDEGLDLLPLVKGMLISDRDQGISESGQQNLQKCDHFLDSI